MTQRPTDPLASLTRFLNARRGGGFVGGAALAGTSVGSGWLRIFSDDGSQRATVDKIPLNSEGEVQLMASCGRTQCIFLASVAPGGSLLAPNTVVRKYSLDGGLLDVFDFGHPISCVGVDRQRCHLWVLLRDGSGFIVRCGDGSRLREISLPPAHAFILMPEEAPGGRARTVLWLLTAKAVEKRDAETLQLDMAVYLPESMARPSTFTSSRAHLWCASANPDGSANFSLAIEMKNGRAATNIIPPPGSVIASDTGRTGTWHMSRHSGGGQLTLINENGLRVIAADLKRWRKGNLCVDKGSGALWMYRDADASGKGCQFILFDPYSQEAIAEHAVPEVEGETTLLISI